MPSTPAPQASLAAEGRRRGVALPDERGGGEVVSSIGLVGLAGGVLAVLVLLAGPPAVALTDLFVCTVAAALAPGGCDDPTSAPRDEEGSADDGGLDGGADVTASSSTSSYLVLASDVEVPGHDLGVDLAEGQGATLQLSAADTDDLLVQGDGRPDPRAATRGDPIHLHLDPGLDPIVREAIDRSLEDFFQLTDVNFVVVDDPEQADVEVGQQSLSNRDAIARTNTPWFVGDERIDFNSDQVRGLLINVEGGVLSRDDAVRLLQGTFAHEVCHLSRQGRVCPPTVDQHTDGEGSITDESTGFDDYRDGAGPTFFDADDVEAINEFVGPSDQSLDLGDGGTLVATTDPTSTSGDDGFDWEAWAASLELDPTIVLGGGAVDQPLDDPFRPYDPVSGDGVYDVPPVGDLLPVIG